MLRRTVSEAELLDAVLGRVPEEQAARARLAARTRLSAGRQYAEWSRVASAVEEGTEPLRGARDRVRDGVLARIAVEGDTPLNVVMPDVRLPRRRWPWAVGVASAAVLLLVGALTYVHHLRSFVLRSAQGQVMAMLSDAAAPRALATGERVRMPAVLSTEADGLADVVLPRGSEVRLMGEARVRLENARSAYQESGTVRYRVTRQGAGLDNFTVNVSQGQIVDLGTEFEVTVSEDAPAVVRVREGRVQIIPTRGGGVAAEAGEQAVLTEVRAAKEPIPDPVSQAEVRRLVRDDDDSLPESLSLTYAPEPAVLQPDDALVSLLRAQRVPLTPSAGTAALVKAPPFTLPEPYLGTLAMRVDGEPRRIAVAYDRKLSGRLRIYLDGNVNGDLTDDVMFEEGEDFVPGRLFPAGLMGRNDALWLRCPVRLEAVNGDPTAVAVMDGIESTNRTYLRGDVVIPSSPAPPEGVRSMLYLLDTDSDGDYGDPEGSLGVWGVQTPDRAAPIPVALQPTNESGLFQGYRWRLDRTLSGEMLLHGERVRRSDVDRLRVGDAITPLELTAIDGKTVNLMAPARGYLLIYVWSTWYSTCQRDIPTGFIDLSPRFKDRGLHMVGISTDYRQDELEAFVEKHGVAFPQIFDGPDLLSGVTAKLGVARSPVAILVDASGTVVSIGKSAEALWSYLDAHLPE